MVTHVDGLFMLFINLMAMLLREHGVVHFGLCGSFSSLELMEKLATHQSQRFHHRRIRKFSTMLKEDLFLVLSRQSRLPQQHIGLDFFQRRLPGNQLCEEALHAGDEAVI